MNSEQQKVLDMLEKGTINAEEATRLLDCLEENNEKERTAESGRVQQNAKRMKGKKLRVEVNGSTEESKEIHVNVSVPLVLARYADNIIANCVPASANDELSKQGIDLRHLNISQIVDTFEDLDEDIVNVDLDQDETCMKVRVYVQ